MLVSHAAASYFQGAEFILCSEPQQLLHLSLSRTGVARHAPIYLSSTLIKIVFIFYDQLFDVSLSVVSSLTARARGMI